MAETKTEKRKASDQQTGANKKQKIEDHTDYKYCRSEENTAAVNNIIIIGHVSIFLIMLNYEFSNIYKNLL